MKINHTKIQSIVLTAAALLLFLFAAPQLIRTTIASENKISYEQPVPSVAHGYILSQQFVPQYDTIKHIDIYTNSLSCQKTQGYLHVIISDSNADRLYEQKIPLTALPDYGMTTIAENVILTAQKTYTLSIEAVDTVDDGPAISFYPVLTAANVEENGFILSYAGLPLENSVLRASFYYSVPLAPVNYIPYCLFIAFAIALFTECLFRYRSS